MDNLCLQLKPVDQPHDLPPGYKEQLHREFVVRYLERMGVEPSRAAVRLMAHHMPPARLKLTTNWRSRGWSSDSVQLTRVEDAPSVQKAPLVARNKAPLRSPQGAERPLPERVMRQRRRDLPRLSRAAEPAVLQVAGSHHTAAAPSEAKRRRTRPTPDEVRGKYQAQIEQLGKSCCEVTTDDARSHVHAFLERLPGDLASAQRLGPLLLSDECCGLACLVSHFCAWNALAEYLPAPRMAQARRMAPATVFQIKKLHAQLLLRVAGRRHHVRRGEPALLDCIASVVKALLRQEYPDWFATEMAEPADELVDAIVDGALGQAVNESVDVTKLYRSHSPAAAAALRRYRAEASNSPLLASLAVPFEQEMPEREREALFRVLLSKLKKR